MSNVRFYVHSGEYEPRQAVIALTLGRGSMIALCMVYALILTHSPWELANILAVIVLAGSIGALFGVVAKHYHIRNERLIIGFGWLLGCLAVYFQWIFYLGLNTDFSALDLIIGPGLVWEGVLFFNQNPPYLILDEVEPSGVLGWIIWTIEAAIITGGSYMGTYATAGQGDNIYCETCQVWTDNDQYTGLLQPVGDCVLLIEQVGESGDLGPIIDLEDIDDPRADFTYVKVKLDSCPVCEQLNVVDLYKVEYSLDDEGDLSSSNTTLLDNLLIDKTAADRLRAAHALTDTL
jgi:hypothetical protein|tara:strand:+ start:339 stop:1211 length:873 start_codon:yes stop_codon:yes gene_type:complete